MTLDGEIRLTNSRLRNSGQVQKRRACSLNWYGRSPERRPLCGGRLFIRLRSPLRQSRQSTSPPLAARASPTNSALSTRSRVDTRFDPPRIIGTDRANGRVSPHVKRRQVHRRGRHWFADARLRGHPRRSWPRSEKSRDASPCSTKEGKVVKQLGHNKNPKEVGTNRTPKSAWRTGFVTAPTWRGIQRIRRRNSR